MFLTPLQTLLMILAIGAVVLYATYAYVDATIREDGPNKGNRVPFSSKHPAVTVRAHLAPVEWPWEDGFDTVPAVKPASNVPCGEVRDMTLIPYGCAKLRMTEMLQLKKIKE